MYDRILSRSPQNPRAVFGRASALDRLSEIEQRNDLLELAIDDYMKVLSLHDAPKSLVLKAGRTCADRQKFRGILLNLYFIN